jgi:hypothetical protein
MLRFLEIWLRLLGSPLDNITLAVGRRVGGWGVLWMGLRIIGD